MSERLPEASPQPAKPQPVLPESSPQPATMQPAQSQQTTQSPPLEPPPPPTAPAAPPALPHVWGDFANTLKTTDPRLYSILSTHTPQQNEDAKITYAVGTQAQKDAMLKILPQLHAHLRSALGNAAIEITIELMATDEAAAGKAYTSADRLALMCRKNPSLTTLVQTLMLAAD